MKLSLQKVLPTSINEKLINSSIIWGNVYVFESGTLNIVHAKSGTGKSTLVKIITGIQKPATGEVFFNENPLYLSSVDKLCAFRKNHLSIIFQDLQLIESLTGIDNVLINFPSSDFINERLPQLIKEFNMETAIKQPAHTLSQGEKQRVAIIRALAKPYDWLIMDEPFSHLDQMTGEIAYQAILADVKAKKAGIIMTSLGNETFIKGLTRIEL